MAKLYMPEPSELHGSGGGASAVERASKRVEKRLGQVLRNASASGASRQENLKAIDDPFLRRSAAKK